MFDSFLQFSRLAQFYAEIICLFYRPWMSTSSFFITSHILIVTLPEDNQYSQDIKNPKVSDSMIAWPSDLIATLSDFEPSRGFLDSDLHRDTQSMIAWWRRTIFWWVKKIRRPAQKPMILACNVSRASNCIFRQVVLCSGAAFLDVLTHQLSLAVAT